MDEEDGERPEEEMEEAGGGSAIWQSHLFNKIHDKGTREREGGDNGG